MILESNCQTKSRTSRLSPTQPFSERLPTLKGRQPDVLPRWFLFCIVVF
ncbi:MAG: hypothetical protein LBK82_08825 [Planctomycetaceae bacterium]|nr:hypothetical protein [Planctomycetaceae bacterium]